MYLDLLGSGVYADLLARPERLADVIPGKGDERVAITGSSDGKMRRVEVNLSAGRALRAGIPDGAALFPDGGGNGRAGRKYKDYVCRKVYKQYCWRDGESLTLRGVFF